VSKYDARFKPSLSKRWERGGCLRSAVGKVTSLVRKITPQRDYKKK